MEREEKEAFWLLTFMLAENVTPSALIILSVDDRKKVMFYSSLVNNYFNEGRLIPKKVLEFIKTKVIISDLRKYVSDILNYKSFSSNNIRETDIIVIKLLLKEIEEQEMVDMVKEERKISISDIKYLEKLIYGKPNHRELILEGCPQCKN